MTELIGIIAAAFELAGLYMLGKKMLWGWIFSCVGNALWIVYVVVSGNAYGLLVVCIAAIVLNILGMKEWGKHAGKG